MTGGAGGVGGMAIQLVSRADVEVVGLVRDPGYGPVVLDLGADTVASDPAGIGSFDAGAEHTEPNCSRIRAMSVVGSTLDT